MDFMADGAVYHVLLRHGDHIHIPLIHLQHAHPLMNVLRHVLTYS